MIFSEIKQQSSTFSQQELALQAIEREFAIHITIHDVYGKIGIAEPSSPFFGRHLHSAESCSRVRREDAGWNNRCIGECFRETELYGGRYQQPFLKECWCGLVELVVPIISDDVHQITLFAGVFKGKYPAEQKMPVWFDELYRDLPELDMKKVSALAPVLQTFGIGLLKAWEQQTFTEVDRLAKIRRFISNHAHEKLTVEDLGRELFISGSRARHLVSELSGRSFSELLTEERMIRARKLLLFSECSLAEIAEASGYANVHYFSRHFSEYYGLPPGRYRKQFQV